MTGPWRDSGPINAAGLTELIRRANARRRSGEVPSAAEEALDLIFGVARRLAVYGSLAPGESNHEQLAGLEGEWTDGQVQGELFDRGWGARMGFPAMRWAPKSSKLITVRLFVSNDLPRHWDRLDRFEGDGYQRILVPVSDRASRLLAVANLYELR